MSEKNEGKLSKDYIGAGIALGTAFGAVFGETIFGSTGSGNPSPKADTGE